MSTGLDFDKVRLQLICSNQLDYEINIKHIKEAIEDGKFNVNTMDEASGFNLFHVALMEGDLELVSFCLKHGANKSLETSSGCRCEDLVCFNVKEEIHPDAMAKMYSLLGMPQEINS